MRVVIGAAITALVATALPSSAHVTVGVPKLEKTKLTYRVPVEPAFTTLAELEAHHTEKLVVTFPAGFKVDKCYKTDDYTCKTTVDTVTWTRRDDSENFGLVTINGNPVVSSTGELSAAETFDVKVRTPGIGGTYLTPAVQFYSDDDFVDPCTYPTCRPWTATNQSPDPTAPGPAPQIRVNGPDRAPKVAKGVFKPLSELGAGADCPTAVLTEADALNPGDANNEADRIVHCGHFGFVYPPGSPPPPPDPNELPIGGKAKLTRSDHHTTAEVKVTGLIPGEVYTAHLHEGTCTNPSSAHYKDDPAGFGGPPNELWPSSDEDDPLAGLIADEDGVARGKTRVDWVARPTARAIWIHEPDDPSAPPGSHVHARIGCADLI